MQSRSNEPANTKARGNPEAGAEVEHPKPNRAGESEQQQHPEPKRAGEVEQQQHSESDIDREPE